MTDAFPPLFIILFFYIVTSVTHRSLALEGARSREGKVSLYYSHDSNVLCVPGNREYVKKSGFEYELPPDHVCDPTKTKKKKRLNKDGIEEEPKKPTVMHPDNHDEGEGD